MQNQSEQTYEILPPAKGGYYTVNLEIDGKRLPYVVFAASEFDAVRKVKYETGCLVTDRDIKGPYHKYI